MPQAYIEPTFSNETRRLLFLKRLWAVNLGALDITAADVSAWQAFKATKPTPGSPDYRALLEEWREARCANVIFFILSKWDSYRLGKVKPAVEAYLALHPNPTQAQAREAVRLQLIDKYALQVQGVDISGTLTNLVSGLVW